MKKINNKILFLILLVTTVIIGIFVYNSGDVYKYEILSDDDYIKIDTWEVADGSEVKLPKGFEYTEDKIVLTHKLDYKENFQGVPYLMMSSKYYDYTLYLDDKEIFKYENPKNGFTNTNGSQIRILRLGEATKGKTLKLEIVPLLGNSIKYLVTPCYIGSKTDLVWSSVKSELPEVLVNIVIIFFGVVLLILYLVMRGNATASKMFYLGMLSITCGIYMLCQFDMLHIMAPNSYMLYFIEFTAIAVIPLIVAIFLYIQSYGMAKKLCKLMVVLLFSNLIIQNILNFLFKVEFRETLWITHGLIIMLGIVIVVSIVTLRRKKEIRYMLVSFMPPIIGGIIDLFIMYAYINERVTRFFPMGLYLFVAMQVWYTCKQYIEINKKQLRSEIYEHLAFTDGLTGLYNRLAFENDVNEKIEGENSACISIDIDNLKIANDTHGHSTGDILIRGMAEILKESVGENGKIYRIGGDEFVVLIHNMDSSKVNELVESITVNKVKYNVKNDVDVEFAIGVAYGENGDTSFENIVTRADLAMYADKRKKKRVLEEYNS